MIRVDYKTIRRNLSSDCKKLLTRLVSFLHAGFTAPRKFLKRPGAKEVTSVVFYLVIVVFSFGLNWLPFPDLPSKITFKDNSQAFEAKDLITYKLNYRDAWFKALSGLAVIIALWITYHRMRTASEEQMTNRFAKAVELLADESPAVRLGALYALERIANDSEKDYDTIIETIAAYVRSRAPWPAKEKKKESSENQDASVQHDTSAVSAVTPSTTSTADRHETKNTTETQKTKPEEDISTAIHILGRRKKVEHPKLFLNDTNLSGLHVTSDKCDFSKAHFVETQLSNASLNRMNLKGANLYKATLKKTFLYKANLNGGILVEVDLSEANLFAAKLNNVDLSYATLHKTDLNRTILDGAILRWADLSTAKNLTWEQLEYAKDEPIEYLRRIRLPGYLLETAPDWYKDKYKELMGKEEAKTVEMLSVSD